MSLFVNVLREEPYSAGLQAVWGAFEEYKPYGSFPSSALLSQDADETQGESLKDEGTSGAQTAEFQVGWNFLSFFFFLTCFLVFKGLTPLFLEREIVEANEFNLGSSENIALVQKMATVVAIYLLIEVILSSM